MLMSTLIPQHGSDHRYMMSNMDHVSNIIALIRDGFHHDAPGGQVELGPKTFPILDYSWSKSLEQSARESLLAMAEIQFAAGAKEVPIHSDARLSRSWKEAKNHINSLEMKLPNLKVISAHVMGGCAMGDEKSAVCNQWGASSAGEVSASLMLLFSHFTRSQSSISHLLHSLDAQQAPSCQLIKPKLLS